MRPASDDDPGRPAPSRALDLGLALAGVALVVAALWAPFGLRVGPTFEDWKALYWSEEWGGVPVLFPNRPLVFAPYTLAHWTGQPLLALNLMQAGAMLGKGVLVYRLVVRLVPQGAPLGFLAGVLAIAYPADTGFFTLRKVMLHLAVLLDLVAVHLLLSLGRRFRWWRLGAVWAAQGLSLASDIPSIPFLLASPALLVWRAGRLTRRLVALGVAWSVVPAIFLAINVAYALRGGTYEAGLWAASGLGPGVAATARDLLARTARAMARHFVGGWADAAARLGPLEGDTGLALLTASVAVGPVLWWLARHGPAPRSWPEARPYVALAGFGLGAMPLGFLLFLPTRWITTDWRVFFHSSIGAGVVVAVACGLLAAAGGSGRRLALALLGGGLMAIALTAALAQHRGYFEASLREQRLVAGIVRAAPRLRPGTVALLLDPPPYVGQAAWRPCALASECLEMILRYLHARRDLDAVFCSPGHRPRGERSEECRFERDELVVAYRDPYGPAPVTRRYPYDRLVAFEGSEAGIRVLPDLAGRRPAGGAAAYDPRARIDGSVGPPPRVWTVFTRWPL